MLLREVGIKLLWPVGYDVSVCESLHVGGLRLLIYVRDILKRSPLIAYDLSDSFLLQRDYFISRIFGSPVIVLSTSVRFETSPGTSPKRIVGRSFAVKSRKISEL